MDLPSTGVLTQLCFNRSEFTKLDFNVEPFLNSLRRRTSLEQIRTDLRLYLKILQNSMIELINQDYADFVNLSSNLVNMRTTVEKLVVDMVEIADEFHSATSELNSTVDELSISLKELMENGRDQLILEQKIRLMSLLGKLGRNLHACNQENMIDSIRLDRLTELMLAVKLSLKHVKWQNVDDNVEIFEKKHNEYSNSFQRVLDTHLVSAIEINDPSRFLTILSGYDSCDRRDSAMVLFIDQFLRPSLETKLRLNKHSVSQSFEAMLTELTQLRLKYTHWFASVRVGTNFLDDCLLTLLVTILDADFCNVLVPIDPDTFHNCYLLLVDFVRSWPSNNLSFLKMALDKFSLLVYYQLRLQNLSKLLDECLIVDHFDTLSGAQMDPFQTTTSITVFHAIENMWSDGVFLTPLISKTWDFTGKLLTRYLDWIESVVDQFNQSTPPRGLVNGSTDDSDRHLWRHGTLLLCDLEVFKTAFSGLNFSSIQPKLSLVCTDTTPFSSFFADFSRLMDQFCSKIVCSIVLKLSASMSQSLHDVSEVPRLYRWTRKATPSQSSTYIHTAFDHLVQFVHLADQLSISHKSAILDRVIRTVLSPFLLDIGQVLESVDKMSTSLSRLKRGSVKNLASSSSVVVDQNQLPSMNDDQKIRLQLQIDLGEFRRRTTELQVAIPGNDDGEWRRLTDLERSAYKMTIPDEIVVENRQ